MKPLLSAKGKNITAWRAVEEFSTEFRQALIDRSASDRCGNAEKIFVETRSALDTAINTQKNMVKQANELLAMAAAATSSAELKEIYSSFYNYLYQHFAQLRSAPAFYQLSMNFLQQACVTVMAIAKDQLGLFARHLPGMTLIALGPAGRSEYSPFCQLQTLLVYDEVTAEQTQTISLFCHTLHDELEAAGIMLDPAVSPRIPKWRGSLTEWQERCNNALHPQANDELIDLCRLIDQQPLNKNLKPATKLKEISSCALHSNHPAMANLVTRISALSNGLGIMGGLKLERGLFQLLDHGLLPFSAALSALVLILKSNAVSSCERINDLLMRREIDVDMAERMLSAWHDLHNLRLRLEGSLPVDSRPENPLSLNPNLLTAAQRQTLKETLESVSGIQRHVEITFSGMGE